jgi:uncharacterized damage-inducible protein DinB
MTDDASVITLDMLRRTLRRDIDALRREVEAYPDDASLWALAPGISNSAGTLALHIAGNLRHFIGATLGNSGYVRDRDAEFSTRDVSREHVANELRDAARAVDRALAGFDAAQLTDEYPLPIAELRPRVGPFLIHLVVHLAYHLGQVDYHRRIVTGSTETMGTLAMPPVFSGEPLDA